MLKIISSTDIDKEGIREFCRLVDNCTFVSEAEAVNIDVNVVRVSARWEPVKRDVAAIIERMKKSGVLVRCRKAEDVEVSQRGGTDWRCASPATVKKLNRASSVRNVEDVFFYPRMVVEMTHNKNGVWSHGQLGIVLDVPSEDTLSHWGAIEVLLAPVGTKNAPDSSETRESLIRKKWKPVQVRRQEDDRCVTIHSNLLGRRYQYPFHARIAMSIHQVMGANLDKIVISVVGDCEPWMAEQGVVIMTRTHTLEDIIFVGDREETKRALVRSLLKPCRYRRYLNNVIRRLARGDGVVEDGGGMRRCIDLTELPWRPLEYDLPDDDGGYVYLLLSMRSMTDTYTGQTNNLQKRLRTHNAGYGSRGTTSAILRPWGIVGFVTGFTGGKSERMSFERGWEYMRDVNGGDMCTASQQMDLAMHLVDIRNRRFGTDLRIVRCLEQVLTSVQGQGPTGIQDQVPTSISEQVTTSIEPADTEDV